MLRCGDPEKEQWIRAYDLLDPRTKAKLEKHIEGCPSCRRRLAFFKAFEDLPSGEHPSAEEMIAFAESDRRGPDRCDSDHHDSDRRDSDRRDSGGEKMALEDAERVRAHIDQCAECRELLRKLEMQDLEIQKLEIQNLEIQGESTGRRDDSFEKRMTGDTTGDTRDSQGPLDPVRAKALAMRYRSLFFDDDGAGENPSNETRHATASLRGRRLLLALTAIAGAVLLIVGFNASRPLLENLGFISVKVVGLDAARSVEPVEGGAANVFRVMSRDSFCFSCRTRSPAWLYSFVLDPNTDDSAEKRLHEADHEAKSRNGFLPLFPQSWDEPLFQVLPGESIPFPDGELGFSVEGESGDVFYIALLAVDRPLDQRSFADTIVNLDRVWEAAMTTGEDPNEALSADPRFEADGHGVFTIITK